ncbi:multidrug efflux system membrane fusion protein [Aliiruegeria haliotis]|uniref:Multidrug efflux system membrane fusion protein n=1 Tax=Aliiruegeria haliotis TaxID=1280846 RepID=A0A2T0RYK8_9RHOB|nr:efflux RND transporter periplasmic adaptor subunit [Aliiruegeria haliotis]PRY26240.1 multidrug efflux system membrane fusion protein [Aliiruegeria haliotis]
MRWFSVLLALLVASVVYLFVMERDSLLRFAGMDGNAPEDVVAETVDETEASADDRVSVVVMASTARLIDNAVQVRGRTEAARQVEVKAETSGLIVSEPLRKGAMVEAGQLLCEIDPGTREAQLAEAQARLAEAQAGLPLAQARLTEAEALLTEAEINDRAATKLIEGGYASETRVASTKAAVSSARAGIESARSGLESATSGVQAAAASVAAAEREIDRLKLVAPFDGLLETDTAELGALMQPGSPCATVIQLDPIKLVGFVPETQVEAIAVGAAARARLVTGTEVEGKVTFLSRSADPVTRTFRVEIEIPNPALRIRDGQTADIAIAAAGVTAHLVPASALTLDDGGRLGVRLAIEDADKGVVAQFAPVDFLKDKQEGVYVAGLDTNVDLIVVGQEYVTDGVPLELTFRDGPATQ